MTNSDLNTFLHSIRADLQLDFKSPSSPDYSIHHGNFFQNWSRERTVSQERGDYDYYQPENEEEPNDTQFDASSQEKNDYVLTTVGLPSAPNRNNLPEISEMSYFNGSYFTKEMFSLKDGTVPKLGSLDDLTAYSSVSPVSNRPFLLQVPSIPTEESVLNEENPQSIITSLFNNIPSNSWILPYILVGAVALAEQREEMKRNSSTGNNNCLSPSSVGDQADDEHDDNYSAEDVSPSRDKQHHKHHSPKVYKRQSSDESLSPSHPNDSDYESRHKEHKHKHKHHHGLGHLFHRKHKDDDDELDDSHNHTPRDELDHPSDSDHGHHSESNKEHKHKHKHHGIGSLFHRKHKDDNGELDDSHNHTPCDELDPHPSDSDHGSHHDTDKEHKHKHKHGIGSLFHRKHKDDGHSAHEGNADSDHSHQQNHDHDKEHKHKHKHHHGLGHLFHRKHSSTDDAELDDSHNHTPCDESDPHPSDSDHGSHHDTEKEHKHKHKHKHGIGSLFHRKHSSADDGHSAHEGNADSDHSHQHDHDHDKEHKHKHKHHHGIGSLFHRKHKGDDYPSSNTNRGGLNITLNDTGHQISSKPHDHCSTESLSDDTSSHSNSFKKMPKFMQRMFLCPNFEDLGLVYLRHGVDGIWCPRHLYLWDNYLFETIPDSDQNLPLGYANLSGGFLEIKNEKKGNRKVGNNQPKDAGYYLKLSYLIYSIQNSKKSEIYLCCEDLESTVDLEKQLKKAIGLGLHEMYEYDPQAKPLGVGRYARVVRAINRHLRDVITKNQSNASLHSLSIQHDSPQSSPRPSPALPIPGQCALKLVDKSEFWNQVRDGKERKDTLVREVLAQSHILNSYAHNINTNSSETSSLNEINASELELPIVILNGMFETYEKLVMDMELMDSGDLYAKLVEHGSGFKEIQVKHITVQLVQAVSLCHENGVAHRDIKLSNITFPERVHHELQNDHSKHKPMQIKLADFGMAGFVNKDGILWGRCGTPGYVAPEIFRYGVRPGYTCNVDMFSLGVAVFTLLAGYEPFGGDDIQQIIAANTLAQFETEGMEWDHVSEDAKDFVKLAMASDPQKRLKVENALKHRWLADYAESIHYPPRYASSRHKNCSIS